MKKAIASWLWSSHASALEYRWVWEKRVKILYMNQVPEIRTERKRRFLAQGCLSRIWIKSTDWKISKGHQWCDRDFILFPHTSLCWEGSCSKGWQEGKVCACVCVCVRVCADFFSLCEVKESIGIVEAWLWHEFDSFYVCHKYRRSWNLDEETGYFCGTLMKKQDITVIRMWQFYICHRYHRARKNTSQKAKTKVTIVIRRWQFYVCHRYRRARNLEEG